MVLKYLHLKKKILGGNLFQGIQQKKEYYIQKKSRFLRCVKAKTSNSLEHRARQAEEKRWISS